MTKEEILADIDAKIAWNRDMIATLESGKLSEGVSPKQANGLNAETEARIQSLNGQIVEYEAERMKYAD